MNNFFSNLILLLTTGNNFIYQSILNKDKKDILSFSLLIGFIIGFFHVLSFSLVFGQEQISSLFILCFFSVLGSIIYSGLAFAKSSLFYYLLGMYKEKQNLLSARDIYKINILSSYPFFLLPSFAIVSNSINNYSLFLLLYFITLIVSAIIRYRLFKLILDINQYFFKVTYIVPVLVQLIVFISLIAIVLIGNLFIIKTFVENIIKNILETLKFISG